jgi:hypothetical protein
LKFFKNSITWCLAEPVSLDLFMMYCVTDDCGLYLIRALHGPISLWRAVSVKLRCGRQHVRQTATCRDESLAEAGWCRHRGRQQLGEIEAESGRDRMWHWPRLACISWGDLWKNFRFFSFVRFSDNF